MTARSHLVATPITDRNGKQTTVHRRPEKAPGGAGRPVPPPALASPAAAAPSARAAAYAERLAAIAETNAQWERREHPAFDAMRGAATERIGFFVQQAASFGRSEYVGQYAGLVGDLFNAGRYVPLLAAEEFAGVYMGLGMNREVSADDDAMLARMKETLPGGAGDLVGVLTMADKLIGLGLLAQDETPEIGHDPRFFAHLRASSIELINYNTNGILDKRVLSAPDQSHWIRLLDEHPDQFDGIAEAIRNGLPCETLRSALEDGHPALMQGAL